MILVAGVKEKAKGRVGVLDIFGFERMQFNRCFDSSLENDDSSLENPDSSVENDDSSLENDDSSLENDDSCDSLEQLCINYANEKLHQTFIDQVNAKQSWISCYKRWTVVQMPLKDLFRSINQVFEGEKKVYREEGLDDSAIAFTDNAMCVLYIYVKMKRF